MSTSVPASDNVPEAQLRYETPHEYRPSTGTLLGLVGLRLIGIYLITIAAASVPQLIYVGVHLLSGNRVGLPPDWSYRIVLIGSPVLNVAIGWWLIARSGRLAGRLFRFGSDDSSDHVTTQQTATLLVAGVGLLIVVLSVSPLLQALFALFSGNSPGFVGRNLSAAVLNATSGGALLAVLAQPAIGFYLLLKADRVAQLGGRYFSR